MSTPRAYVGAFTISLGLIQVTGKLLPVIIPNRTRQNSFRRVLPDRKEPTLVSQVYIAADETVENFSALYQQGDLLQAKEMEDGTLRFVDPEDVKEARTSGLPLNLAEIKVFRASDVEGRIWSDPDGGAYVFAPQATNDHYSALVAAIDSGEHVFLGVANIRNSESFFRLRTWAGHLVVEKILWPDEVNEFEPVEVTSSSRLAGAITEMVRGLEEDFDPEAFQSSTKAKLIELAERLGHDGEKVAKPKKSEAKADPVDLLAQIEAFNAKR